LIPQNVECSLRKISISIVIERLVTDYSSSTQSLIIIIIIIIIIIPPL